MKASWCIVVYVEGERVGDVWRLHMADSCSEFHERAAVALQAVVLHGTRLLRCSKHTAVILSQVAGCACVSNGLMLTFGDVLP